MGPAVKRKAKQDWGKIISITKRGDPVKRRSQVFAFPVTESSWDLASAW